MTDGADVPEPPQESPVEAGPSSTEPEPQPDRRRRRWAPVAMVSAVAVVAAGAGLVLAGGGGGGGGGKPGAEPLSGTFGAETDRFVLGLQVGDDPTTIARVSLNCKRGGRFEGPESVAEKAHVEDGRFEVDTEKVHVEGRFDTSTVASGTIRANDDPPTCGLGEERTWTAECSEVGYESSTPYAVSPSAAPPGSFVYRPCGEDSGDPVADDALAEGLDEEIVTEAGVLRITGAELTKSLGPPFDDALPGSNFLVVSVEPASPGETSTEAFSDLLGRRGTGAAEIAVESADGTRADLETGGLLHGDLVMIFVMPLGQRSFELSFADNPPISLEFSPS